MGLGAAEPFSASATVTGSSLTGTFSYSSGGAGTVTMMKASAVETRSWGEIKGGYRAWPPLGGKRSWSRRRPEPPSSRPAGRRCMTGWPARGSGVAARPRSNPPGVDVGDIKA